MTGFKRHAVAGVVLAVAGLVAGCSGGSDASSPASGEATQGQAQGDGAAAISNPKEVTGTALCDLLPSEMAKSLGVVPEGKERADALDPNAPQSCVWKTPDGSGSLSATAFPDRSIETYYQFSSEFVDFGKLNIAGHPAVRANRSDPKADGSCAMFLATKQGQMLGVSSSLRAEKDPCGVTRKMLESAITTLSAAN